MFGRSITLFRLFGFDVRLDLSWLLLAGLVVWTLASGYFPSYHPGYERPVYWWMSIAGAVGLFASLILHELSHSVVARQFRIPIRHITLFMFGGVAEMEEEPPTARAEFLMAIAGPIASFLISAVCWVASISLEGAGAPGPAVAVLFYLSVVNALLAIFNLLPAFPLDGGRAFRAVMWWWKGDLRWATRVASGLGFFFGTGMIVLGVIQLLGGNFAGGLWWGLIGLFLNSAARTSYAQVVAQRELTGLHVKKLMTGSPVIVPAETRLEDFIEAFVYRHHHDFYPVMEDGRLLGCVTAKAVKAVPREEWSRRSVREITSACSEHNTVDPAIDAMQALKIMQRSGNSRLLVAKGGELLGILALKDLLHYLAMKSEFEGG